jgi:hypothetical protein
MAAELKKYYGWNKRATERAETYIGHFLWRYSHSENEFHEITQALPFFMSLGLLRMARWRGESHYRDHIIKEANACLKAVR